MQNGPKAEYNSRLYWSFGREKNANYIVDPVGPSRLTTQRHQCSGTDIAGPPGHIYLSRKGKEK
jgi:hypothetical protein